MFVVCTRSYLSNRPTNTIETNRVLLIDALLSDLNNFPISLCDDIGIQVRRSYSDVSAKVDSSVLPNSAPLYICYESVK